jgi:hypothetical protein
MLPARPSYRRIQAPSSHRPTSWGAQGLLRGRDRGAGLGVRSYSDEPLKAGRLLELDVFLPSGGQVTALVQVEWCDPLPQGTPARFDVGLRVVQMAPDALAALDGVLAPS